MKASIRWHLLKHQSQDIMEDHVPLKTDYLLQFFKKMKATATCLRLMRLQICHLVTLPRL